MTFLAKHPTLAQAVLAGFEYTSACAHEDWPEGLADGYVSAAEVADDTECQRLLDEADERMRMSLEGI